MGGGRVILLAVPASARRTIVAWTLYDFANSAFAAVVLSTVYPAYYANIVVGNADGRGDFWWGAAVSTAMVIGALTSPPLGGIADHAGARWNFFVAFSVVSIAATALHPMRLATAATRGGGETLVTLREILRDPARAQMRRFLTAYLVYEDGVNTVVTFAGVFAAKTLGFTFTEIIALFMLVQVTALLGSAAWARPTDSRGPRFVVGVNLVQWALVTIAAFFVVTKDHFWVVAILAGTGLGAVQAASRTFMATLVPPGREAEFFGFYSLVGKTGAIFGPLVFGGVSWLLSGNQRAAIVSVGLFFVVGLVLLGRVSAGGPTARDRKSTRLNSSHLVISYAVFCLKKKKQNYNQAHHTQYTY